MVGVTAGARTGEAVSASLETDASVPLPSASKSDAASSYQLDLVSCELVTCQLDPVSRELVTYQLDPVSVGADELDPPPSEPASLSLLLMFPACFGLGWAGLGWAGLGWAGLGWAGLGFVSGCGPCASGGTGA